MGTRFRRASAVFAVELGVAKAIECAGNFVLRYDKRDLIERLAFDVASQAVSKTLASITLESHQFCVGLCFGVFLLRSEPTVLGC